MKNIGLKLQLKTARLIILQIAMNDTEDKNSDSYKLCYEKYEKIVEEINEIEDYLINTGAS